MCEIQLHGIVKYSLQMFKFYNIFAAGIEIWCNGSTTDFGSVCSGSNPDISTRAKTECPHGHSVLCVSEGRMKARQLSILNSGTHKTRRRAERPFLFLLYSAPAAAVTGCATVGSKSCETEP